MEDFHTKTLRLVKEAEYPEGETWNRILRDTLISGLTSDKICAKIIKEGKDVTLPRIMEIARLEVSTQRHIDRMQETAKVNYVQYGKGSKKGKPRSGKFQGSANSESSGCSGTPGNPSKYGGKGKKVPLPTDICWRCGKDRHQKGQPCKAVEAVCMNCSIKGHYEKVCITGQCSTHLVNVSKASISSTSYPDYYNEHGNPMYAHILNVQENNHRKHLIQSPISIDLEKVRNSVECSTCPTVLLKADTDANVNLMNSRTFDSIFNDRTMLQPSSLRMEAYRNNSAVEVLGRFHAFLRWKGRVYKQLFYVTNVNNSPNLLSRDGCYTIGVIKPCYSVEFTRNSSNFQANLEVTPTQPTQHLDEAKLHGDSFTNYENEGTVKDKWTDSKKCSSEKEELQGAPLMKQRILDVYCDVLLEFGSSLVILTSSSSNQISNPQDMHQGEFQFICRLLSTRKSGIWNNLEF